MRRVFAKPRVDMGPVSINLLEEQRRNGVSDDAIADYMASASPNFARKLEQVRAKSGGNPNHVSGYLNWRFYGDSQYSPAHKPEEERGFTSKLADKIYQDIIDIEQTLEGYHTGKESFASALPQTMGNIMSIGAAVPQQMIESGLEYGLEATGLGRRLGQAGEAFAGTELGKDVISTGQQIAEGYGEAREASGLVRGMEGVAEGGLAMLDVAGVGYGPRMLKAGAGKIPGVRNIPGLKPPPVAGAVVPPTAVTTTGRSLKGRLGEAIKGQIAKRAELKAQPQVYQDAVKAGVDERYVKLINDATTQERRIMSEMLSLSEEGAKDVMKANQAIELGGQQVINRAEYLVNARKAVGQRLGNVVMAHSDEFVNLNRTNEALRKGLADLGFYVENGKWVATGKASVGDLPFIKQLVAKLGYTDEGIKATQVKSANDVTEWMFKEIRQAGLSNKTYTDDITRFANNLNSAMIDDIGVVAEGYRPLKTAYATMSKPINDLAKYIQFKKPLDQLDTATLRSGEKARALFGRAGARPREIINPLDEVARKYGFESDVDIERIMRFADHSERYFPNPLTTGFAGETAKGVPGALDVGLAATPGSYGKIRFGAKVIEGTKGITMGRRIEDQIQAMKNMLKASDEAIKPVPPVRLDTVDDEIRALQLHIEAVEKDIQARRAFVSDLVKQKKVKPAEAKADEVVKELKAELKEATTELNQINKEVGTRVNLRETKEAVKQAKKTLGEEKKLAKPKKATPKKKVSKEEGWVRYADSKNASTNNLRGGTWFTQEGKAAEAITDAMNPKNVSKVAIGGKNQFSTNFKPKKPLVIKNAILEDGSFAVINSGYEKFIPKKYARLAEELWWAADDMPNKAAYDTKVMDILSEAGIPEKTAVRSMKLGKSNNFDVAMDLIVGKGAKEKGYDAIILSNERGQHMLALGDAKIISKVKKGARTTKKPPIDQTKVLNPKFKKKAKEYLDKNFKNKIPDDELMEAGTVGEWIKEPKLRKVLKDALDVQVTFTEKFNKPSIRGQIGELPDGTLQIQLKRGLSDKDMARVLTEEALHALRMRKGRTNFEAEQLLDYLKRPTEKSAKKGVDSLLGEELFGLPVKKLNIKKVPKELKPLLRQAKKSNSINEFIKKNKQLAEFDDLQFPKLGDKTVKQSKVGVIPMNRFNGIDIKSSQNTVSVAGVKKYVKLIKQGERPPVLVEAKPEGNFVIDGHTRLTAYEQLGMKEIPVIDVSSKGNVVGKSALKFTDFYKLSTSK